MKNQCRTAAILAAVMLAIACGRAPEAEGNISIVDPTQRVEFLKQLDARGVQYRTGPSGVILYPESQQSSVNAVTEALWGEVDETSKGARVNMPEAPDVAAILVGARIQYEVLCDDKFCTFTWPAHLDHKALALVDEVLRKDGV